MTGEAAKANETAFIGCRYGYGGSDEFGDGDLLAEDSVEIPRLLKRLVSSTPWRKPWRKPWREAIGRPWGRDYRRLRRIPGFHKFVKKERAPPVIG